MNNTKMTPHVFNEKEEKGEAEWFSEVCFWERSEGRSGKGEVFSFSSNILCACVCVRAQCLLPNWNVSCLLPPSHLYPRHIRLAPRHQHSSVCPIPLSLESQGVLQHTKRKVNLQACTARRRVAISLLGKKKISFFVVFLLITALCNIRKHTGTPKVLLTPFFLVICLEEKKKT